MFEFRFGAADPESEGVGWFLAQFVCTTIWVFVFAFGYVTFLNADAGFASADASESFGFVTAFEWRTFFASLGDGGLGLTETFLAEWLEAGFAIACIAIFVLCGDGAIFDAVAVEATQSTQAVCCIGRDIACFAETLGSWQDGIEAVILDCRRFGLAAGFACEAGTRFASLATTATGTDTCGVGVRVAYEAVDGNLSVGTTEVQGSGLTCFAFLLECDACFGSVLVDTDTGLVGCGVAFAVCVTDFHTLNDGSVKLSIDDACFEALESCFAGICLTCCGQLTCFAELFLGIGIGGWTTLVTAWRWIVTKTFVHYRLVWFGVGFAWVINLCCVGNLGLLCLGPICGCGICVLASVFFDFGVSGWLINGWSGATGVDQCNGQHQWEKDEHEAANKRSHQTQTFLSKTNIKLAKHSAMCGKRCNGSGSDVVIFWRHCVL